MTPSSRLETIIRQHDLTPCVYFDIHCPKHGEVRLAVSRGPSGERCRCPVCHHLCSFALLGRGATARALPFYAVEVQPC